MNDLCFNETVLIYPIRRDRYGTEVYQTPVEVPAIYVQSTGFAHSGNQDAITAGPSLYLPGDDDFVTAKGYRLEGMVVEVNPFDAPAHQQHFRITEVTPARDVLLDNRVRHVECALTKVTDFSYADVVS